MTTSGEGSPDIRTRRRVRRIGLSDLARQASVPLPDLKKWERGLAEPPVEALARIAGVLDCPLNELAAAQTRLWAGPAVAGEGYVTATPKSGGRSLLGRRESPDGGMLRVLDLFCGVGGLSHGLELAGGFVCTAGVDLLNDRIESFHLNHPCAVGLAADIGGVSSDELAALALGPDVIVGGSPCQGFSSIRPYRVLTEGDGRNSLIETFLLLVGKLEPRWFVFENVVGLLTHEGGRVFESIISGFQGLGYTVDWRVVNAAHFGVPQNRERVIVVGNRLGIEFDWPPPTHWIAHRSMAGSRARRLLPRPLFNPVQPALTLDDAIHDLPPVAPGQAATSYRSDVDPTPFEEQMRAGATRLTLHEATRHSEAMLAIIRKAGRNRAALGEGVTTSGFSSCYSRLAADEPSTTITVNFIHPSSNRCIHPSQDRGLTPREGARLQSFEDAFGFAGSRVQIVKQIGNAVPPLLAKAIGAAIAEQDAGRLRRHSTSAR